MKLIACILVGAAGAAGCAGVRMAEEPSAPYKAVVVFHWKGQGLKALPLPSGGGGGGGGGTEEAVEEKAVPPPESGSLEESRTEVEDAILDGLEKFRVFSRLVPSDWDSMQVVARKERADLIVLIDFASFCRWQEEEKRVLGGRAALSTVLWLATGIGGWWIADHEIPAWSEVEVSWKRPDLPDQPISKAPDRSDPTALRDQFPVREPLSTGEYQLSLWDRARPWRYPWAYLLSIVVPPAFLPIQDDRQVETSLRESALEDLNRELARKLKGGYLRAGGAPFLFHLDSPPNGKEVDGEAVKLSFRYTLEPGFQTEKTSGLASLLIEVESPTGRRQLREYRGEDIQQINLKISENQPIEEDVGGLQTGVNLVSFIAQTEQAGQWITNTVAIRRR